VANGAREDVDPRLWPGLNVAELGWRSKSRVDVARVVLVRCGGRRLDGEGAAARSLSAPARGRGLWSLFIEQVFSNRLAQQLLSSNHVVRTVQPFFWRGGTRS
jgi:hypothetical protein